MIKEDYGWKIVNDNEVFYDPDGREGYGRTSIILDSNGKAKQCINEYSELGSPGDIYALPFSEIDDYNFKTLNVHPVFGLSGDLHKEEINVIDYNGDEEWVNLYEYLSKEDIERLENTTFGQILAENENGFSINNNNNKRSARIDYVRTLEIGYIEDPNSILRTFLNTPIGKLPVINLDE